MKILVIGQTSSLYIKEYIKRTLDLRHDEIFVLYDASYGEDVKKEYEAMGVHLIYTDRGIPILQKIPKIRTAVNLLFNIKKFCHDGIFDLIVFQGMPINRIAMFYEKFVLKYAKDIICMYWGTDLLATPEKNIHYSDGILEAAKYILLGSNNLRDKFTSIYGDKFADKTVEIRLGASMFDVMNRIKEKYTKEDCKAYFNIPKNAIVIAVGYNGRKRQQHIQVLQQLKKLKIEDKEIYIILHLGYSLDSLEYRKELEQYLNDNFQKFIIIDEFLNEEKIAMLRYAVDIFIHAQISDAFAGSIKEYLYAGAILINPIWINYSECAEYNIAYYEYSDWQQIPEIVNEILNSDGNSINNNPKILYDNFSWEALKYKWDIVHGKR